jgi:hypothetical protein
MTQRPGLPMTRPSPIDVTFLGPPAVLEGEDAASYDTLLARISGTLQPADVLEDIWVRDVVDLAWEIMRLRRLKAELMKEAAYEGVEKVLDPRTGLFFEETRVTAYDWAKRWATGDREAIAMVDRVLASCGLSMETVRARALSLHIDQFERIDRMIAMAEGRRDSFLREIDRHRANFAQRLRRATADAEDAEFEVIAPQEAASAQ